MAEAAGNVVVTERDDGILDVVLRTPGRHNAMSLGMWKALGAAVGLAAGAGRRGLLLRGDGESFCSGGDMHEYARIGTDAAFGIAYVETFTRTIAALRTIPIPTLALLDGAVVGAGAALAAACDFRIATPATRLSITALKLGLVFPHPELIRLASVLGVNTLKRVIFLNEALNADALAACGFVERIVDRQKAEDCAVELLLQLMSYSPESYCETKQRFALIDVFTVMSTDSDNTEAFVGFQKSFHAK